MTVMHEVATSGGRLTTSYRWPLVVAGFAGGFPITPGVPPVAERRPSVTGGNTLHRPCGAGAGVADRLCPCRPSVEAVPARR